MTTGDGSARFQPRPRRGADRDPHDARNFEDELSKVLIRLDRISGSDRADFVDGSAVYDSASIAIIRTAALLEEFAGDHRISRLSDDEQRGIRTMRNIAAHGGYVGMDDNLFWRAVTVQLPELIRRLLMA